MSTVIFSNMGDIDTEVLKYIWLGIPKVKVVEINKNTKNPIELVNEAIKNEHDTLIMCGHGTPEGLLNPTWEEDSYLINSSNKDLICANRVIGVWCHAKDFAEHYGLKGFWSSMFISNYGEARMNGITSVSGKSITDQEILFCYRLNELLKSYVPMKTWVSRLTEQADMENPVVKFNYDGLRFYKKGIVRKVDRECHNKILLSESERWNITALLDNNID